MSTEERYQKLMEIVSQHNPNLTEEDRDALIVKAVQNSMKEDSTYEI